MIFQPGADDLPLVVQILRADKADDTVNEKRLESACDSVSSCFERHLIDSVMRLGGQSATLARFEIHHVIPGPADIPLAMMFENLFMALAQHVQSDSETAVGRFRTRDGLEKKVNRRPAIQRGQLSSDMRQATDL